MPMLTPRASMMLVRSCCCCWRRASVISRGKELKLVASCSILVSRPPICFSRSSLRSFSSVIRSYMTFCICKERTNQLANLRSATNPLSRFQTQLAHFFTRSQYFRQRLGDHLALIPQPSLAHLGFGKSPSHHPSFEQL